MPHNALAGSGSSEILIADASPGWAAVAESKTKVRRAGLSW
jgi:hypothetical protein